MLKASVSGGKLVGWVAGEGLPVLLLHGGPGMNYDYLDDLAGELVDGFLVASYQQRGLEPSTLEGPFTIAQEVGDVAAVLDGLQWERALMVGHSWGGQLALRVAAAHPDRLLGVLAVDPIGVVGDGGMAAFGAEMIARTPESDGDRARELGERAMAGEGTPEEFFEYMRLIWSAYFGDPGNVPGMPDIRVCIEAFSRIMGEMTEGLEPVAAELAKGRIPYGIVAGAASPIPWGQAARSTIELSSQAFLDVVPTAGHFVWVEAPGAVRAALERLTAVI